MELFDSMALYVEVVKAMSFRRAAEATGIPTSTLSRRISNLEKAIGLQLLHRTTRKIELTEAGAIYFQCCRRIVEEAKLAHEHLGELLQQPTGTLRASLPVDFAVSFLAPVLAEFTAQYPGIRFEFDMSARLVDLMSEPFDMTIRMGEVKDSSLIARRLANLTVCAWASPGYLAAAGEPNAPVQLAQLAQHQCLRFSKSSTWILQRDSETASVEIDGRIVVNNIGMIKQLACLDHGVALLPAEVVQDEMQQGRLMRILPDWAGVPIPVYALTATRLLPAKTQCFIAFLHRCFAENR